MLLRHCLLLLWSCLLSLRHCHLLLCLGPLLLWLCLLLLYPCLMLPVSCCYGLSAVAMAASAVVVVLYPVAMAVSPVAVVLSPRMSLLAVVPWPSLWCITAESHVHPVSSSGCQLIHQVTLIHHSLAAAAAYSCCLQLLSPTDSAAVLYLGVSPLFRVPGLFLQVDFVGVWLRSVIDGSQLPWHLSNGPTICWAWMLLAHILGLCRLWWISWTLFTSLVDRHNFCLIARQVNSQF